MAKSKKNTLSPLENRVMKIIWERGEVTADDVRGTMEKAQPMKDSTVRTVLRRLEEKGYAKHRVAGRTYVYSPTVESDSVAAGAVRSIVERFCNGSVEDLIVGMVDNELVTADKLKSLAAKIAKAEAAEKKSKPKS